MKIPTSRQFGLWLLTVAVLACPACTVNRQRAEVQLERGEQALAANDVNTALAAFQETVRLDPLWAEGHQKLGSAYRQAGQLENAAESLETAVRLDPVNFAAMFDLGEVYRLLDNWAQAIRAYNLACKLKPDAFEPRFRLASAYHHTGELTHAIQEYDEALSLDDSNAYAWSNLGAAHDALGADYEAIRAYKRSLECDTQQPIVLVNLATVYLNQERFKVAERTLLKALEMAPSLSTAHERLGYCHWRQQRYTEAAAAYRLAIDYDNRNSRAYAGFGVVRMTQYLLDPALVGNREEAVESWHRSLELDPNQPKLRELIEKYRVKHETPVLEMG